MNFIAFKESIATENVPSKLTVFLTALWYDAKGDWHKAHDLINDLEGRNAAWLHAYLHRKEGDKANAGYWYRRAGKEFCTTPLQEEWNVLALFFLEEINQLS